MITLAIDDVIKSIRDLPSLPLIVVELIKSFEQSNASVGGLAEKVSRDQALAAKTLRLANSSFYGLQHKVKTISQAITVLGFDSVRALITSAAVIDSFSGGKHDSFDFKSFWQHSIGVALCAKGIARELKLNEDNAFISGLLHDIGKLVLVTRFPQQYAQVIAYRSSHDCSALEAECEVLGIDHAAVGRALANHWKFPPPIQRAIADHHTPVSSNSEDMQCVVHVADVIVHALDLVGDKDEMVPPLVENVWNGLNLGAAALNRVFRGTECEFEEACRILAA
jgi:putative nucleotidyltransferase with HDIG domain